MIHPSYTKKELFQWSRFFIDPMTMLNLITNKNGICKTYSIKESVTSDR